MAIPSTPHDWVSGEYPTTANFDNIKDWLVFLANPPTCRVYHNATQSIADNGFLTVLFNSERYDTDTMHDSSSLTSRITIKTAGVYLLTFTASMSSVATDYQRIICYFVVNGTNQIGLMPARVVTPLVGYNDDPHIACSTQWKFAVNDYVEVVVYQDNAAGTARNLATVASTSPEFAATWVGIG